MTMMLHKMSRDQIIENLVEVDIPGSDEFLKIRETLTRIGIANRATKTLYQSCHILHKRGKYYIVHFKELFGLDGREVELTDDDIKRRNDIAYLVSEWGLCKLVTPIEKSESAHSFAVIPYKEKSSWSLLPKYQIGNN